VRRRRAALKALLPQTAVRKPLFVGAGLFFLLRREYFILLREGSEPMKKNLIVGSVPAMSGLEKRAAFIERKRNEISGRR
jgi:hypothetical protein